MFHRRCTPLFLTLAFAACGDPAAPPVTNKDATPGGNADAAPMMMGNSDAGPNGLDALPSNNADAAGMGNADAAPIGGACNHITGGGCPTMGDVCYYVPSSPMTGDLTCRISIGMPSRQHEETCSLGMQDCAPGFSCLAFQNVNGGVATCLKGCATEAECTGLMGAGMNGYACAIQTADMKAKFCVAKPPSCDPRDVTTCPMNQYCEVTNAGSGCLPEGMVMAGGTCTALGQCMRGAACLNFGSGSHCETICDPMLSNCPTMGDACVAITGENFGFCEAGCDVFAQDCANGDNCTAVSATAVACLGSGMVPLGGACTAATDCVKGGHCLGPTAADRHCLAACDMTHMCPNMAMCQMAGVPWGGVCP